MNNSELLIDDDVKFSETNSHFKQNYCLISFISPNEEIDKKLISDIFSFMFYELNKKIKEIAYVAISEFNIVINSFIDQDLQFELSSSEISDLKKELIFNIETDQNTFFRENMFNKEQITKILESIDFTTHNKQSNIHGIKVRGIFTNLKDADDYAIKVRESENKIHCFVGSVGHWCPTDPKGTSINHKTYNADKNNMSDSNIEYDNIMHGYEDNNIQKDNFLNAEKKTKTNFLSEEEELRKKTKEKIELLKQKRTKKK